MRLIHRLHFIKLITLLGLLASVLLSSNLWGGMRYFPKVSVFQDYQTLLAPFDYAYLILLVCLIIISIFSQSKIPLLLIVLFSIFLCIDDQNRLQPWFFDYTLILFVLFFFKQRVDEPNNYTSIFITIQILVASIYIFSGLQKLNSHFVDETLTWIIKPLQDSISERQNHLILKLGHAIPYIESIIGIGLLIKPLRYIMVPLVVMMHVIILIFIGPLGNDYNAVVWPWNIVMIILNLLLFGNVKAERFFDATYLFKNIYFYTIVVLMLVLPIFSFKNKYDSYLSSSLYSGNTNNCVLILSDKAYKKLPYYIKNFVTRDTDYNILYIKKWAQTELSVPCVPEYRIFKSIQNYVIEITNTDAQNVKLKFTEREKILNND